MEIKIVKSHGIKGFSTIEKEYGTVTIIGNGVIELCSSVSYDFALRLAKEYAACLQAPIAYYTLKTVYSEVEDV